MTISAQQNLCMRTMLGRALSANSFLYANPSEGEVLSFWTQLVTEASGAAALSTAQQAAIGYAFRGLLSGNFPGVGNPSDSQVLDFWAQITADAAGAAALSVPRYQAFKQTLLNEVALNYPGTTNPTLLNLLGYINAVAPTFSGNFATLFSGTLLCVVQGDRGIAQSGGIITGVTDQSASIAFASNGAGQRPLVGVGYNGHASITFDGVDDELDGLVSIPVPSTTPYYVYAVFKPTTKAGQANYFGGNTGAGVLYSSTGNVNTITQTSGAGGNASSMTNALTRVYAEFTGTTSDRLKSGANSFVTGASAGVLSSATLIIGAGLVGGGFAAQIDLALLVYSTGVLTAPTLASIDAQANSYWGSVAT